MLKDSRKPGLPRLTKQSMEGAPEEKWVESIKTTVNLAAQELDDSRSKQMGIQLLKNADVEYAEVDVSVPDPWIEITSFDNGWSDNNGNAYLKRPDGVVELKVSIIGGTAGNPAFTLPVGYRPPRAIMSAGWDSSLAAAGSYTILTTGEFSSASGTKFDTYISFLASDSTPVPLSCWPKFIRTKFSKVSGISIVGVDDQETSKPLPAGAALHATWEMSNIGGFPQVKLLNIAGLPYNRKSRIKLLIFGG